MGWKEYQNYKRTKRFLGKVSDFLGGKKKVEKEESEQKVGGIFGKTKFQIKKEEAVRLQKENTALRAEKTSLEQREKQVEQTAKGLEQKLEYEKLGIRPEFVDFIDAAIKNVERRNTGILKATEEEKAQEVFLLIAHNMHPEKLDELKRGLLASYMRLGEKFKELHEGKLFFILEGWQLVDPQSYQTIDMELSGQ